MKGFERCSKSSIIPLSWAYPVASWAHVRRKFVEHRVADKRVLRLIRKWLRAGVMEEGRWKESEEGTPQGATISPLLANLYLHYVFDLWIQLATG